MRFSRLTTRRLMALVAVVGALLAGSCLLRSRSRAFKARASYHAGEIFGIHDEIAPDNDGERFWFSDAIAQPHNLRRFDPPGWLPPSASDPPEIVAWRGSQKRRLDYHEMMRRKYERAARRPWLLVPLDPPPPKPDGAFHTPSKPSSE